MKQKNGIVVFLALVMILGLLGSAVEVKAANKNLTSGAIAAHFNSKVGASVPAASCLAFIADNFAELGATRSSACCAYKYGSSHIVSTSMDNIPIGADVFLNWGSNYGGTIYICPTCGNKCHHIGVYVGDDYVVHTSGGKVIKTKLSTMLSSWNLDFRGWGYHGNVTIEGSTVTDTTEGIRVKNTGVTNVTSTTARINASVSPVGDVTECGFYYGTSQSNMQKVVENATTKDCASIWYDLGTGKWTGALQRGTTYYYQIYAVINGVTYRSTVDSFTTTGDAANPVIVSASIKDLSSGGYTVEVVATDNVGVARVSCPTWTLANNQDDLVSDWYNNAAAAYISGNTYTYRVNISDHNNERGVYATHVYVYDMSGNYVMTELLAEVPQPVIYVTGISLNKSNLSLNVNETSTLTATVSPSNATNTGLTWSSSNTSVATVSTSGVVKAVGKGSATITATAKDGSEKKASCSVTVTQPVTGISLNKSNLSLNVNETSTLTATVSPFNATNTGVTWSSSNTSVVTVSTSGVVKAVGKGSATITATAKDGSGKKASCTVTVNATTYEGDVNTELQKFTYDASSCYISGQIVVVEWCDINGDGIKESTVPKKAPIITFDSTDGTESIEVFVTATGTNTYYFDRLLAEGLTAGKEYVFNVTSGDTNNISPYRTVPVYTGTSGIGSAGVLGTVKGQILKFKTAATGALVVYGQKSDQLYIGNVNAELQKFSLDNDTKYVSGQIVVVEWIDIDGDGVMESTVPSYLPVMTFDSTDGTESIEVFVTATGTNTYYFDRLLSGGLTPGKEYVFHVTSGNPHNVSEYKTIPIYTGTSGIGNQGVLGTINGKHVMFKTAYDGSMILYNE